MCTISAYAQTLNEYLDTKNTKITSEYPNGVNICCSPNDYVHVDTCM